MTRIALTTDYMSRNVLVHREYEDGLFVSFVRLDPADLGVKLTRWIWVPREHITRMVPVSKR
jgi:hypothetical protein